MTIAKERRCESSAKVRPVNAAIGHVRDWFLGTQPGDWVSMGVVSDGSYGVPDDLIAGFPCISRDGEWEIVQGLHIDEFSRMRIDASAKELMEERDAVQALGLI